MKEKSTFSWLGLDFHRQRPQFEFTIAHRPVDQRRNEPASDEDANDGDANGAEVVAKRSDGIPEGALQIAKWSPMMLSTSMPPTRMATSTDTLVMVML